MNHLELKDFSDFSIGDKVEFDVLITEELHNNFSNIFDDYSPIHTNKSFSSKTKFEDRIGYGFMLNGFLSALYSKYLTGGASICIKQDSNFIKPFFIGDNIKIYGEIISKIDSTRFLEVEVKMFRELDECIFKGKGLIQVLFDKKNFQPLYINNDSYIDYNDFLNTLINLGIKKGDTIFVHSDISVFGKLGTLDKDFLFESLINSLKDAVGEEGTILMPTFSYSFCNNEIYDLKKTSSKVGVLTEYFRKQNDTSRTKDPIFSVSIWGKKKNLFLDVGKNVFGKDSIFEKLHKNNGKIVFLGAPFQSCTFIHYIEQAHGIPYRYFKKFRGNILADDEKYSDEFIYLVRYLDKNVILDTKKFEERLLRKTLMKNEYIGNGSICVVNVDTLFNEGFDMLNEDIYCFLKENPDLGDENDRS